MTANERPPVAIILYVALEMIYRGALEIWPDLLG